ncbi:B-cell receptor-associated 31-like [Forsythia ovata]|uniref:Endoplasmic reticulum transmembrane protein n=1 Tax=Forsythia ovata TaxID=205694 RepID=A0ABD1S6I4_9LAMI
MLQPLFYLVFAEVFVILLLLFRTPLRKPLLLLLDKAKQGRGPVVASTAGGTLFVILVSILYNIISTQKRSTDGSPLNTTDQLILANHLLVASLLGVSLFLGLMIDRLHYYIKELRLLRKHMEAVRTLDKRNDEGKIKGKLKTEVAELDEEEED